MTSFWQQLRRVLFSDTQSNFPLGVCLCTFITVHSADFFQFFSRSGEKLWNFYTGVLHGKVADFCQKKGFLLPHCVCSSQVSPRRNGLVDSRTLPQSQFYFVQNNSCATTAKKSSIIFIRKSDNCCKKTAV